MFKLNNSLPDFAAQPNLYCVWIRANERPNASLVSVWMDRRMTAFESATSESLADSQPEQVLDAELDPPLSASCGVPQFAPVWMMSPRVLMTF